MEIDMILIFNTPSINPDPKTFYNHHHMRKSGLFLSMILILIFAVACQSVTIPASTNGIKVIAAESFLADIAQQVGGDRTKVDALIPAGIDPHSFEPTPREMAKVADCDLLIISGNGLEEWLKGILTNIGGSKKIIEASTGLQSNNGDPHFWLDPNNVITYVNNIQDALTSIDPLGKAIYAANAANYIELLKQLDAWIQDQASKIPPAQRLLVTNHETLGYFAARYGFQIVGSLIPSLSPDASPSAQQLAQLTDAIRSTTAKVIFLDVGNNPQLAAQIGSETKARVVTQLYSESLSTADGPAPDYITMMKYNVSIIVSALQ
jgi:ABC-type Zn uptake system ZnuABC Zn-binding protein ZnuA